MADRFTDRLSEYLDGDLDRAERTELEAHLRGCAECEATLEDLRAVAARAAALEDRPPESDLWTPIADRIGFGESAPAARLDGPARRRFSLSVPQAIAAGVALMTLSAGTMWMAMSGGAAPDVTAPVTIDESAPVGPDLGTPGGGVPVANFAERKYGAAIADLEQLLAEQRAVLEPETVRAIEANLVIIDRAIEQARRALADDPASDYLNSYLAGAMRQKLELLRRATFMTGASS